MQPAANPAADLSPIRLHQSNPATALAEGEIRRFDAAADYAFR
jgi:hypothetical protein